MVTQETKPEFTFYRDCTSSEWTDDTVDLLSEMISSRYSISRNTFIKKIGRVEYWMISDSLGYARRKSNGLTMGDDWHVEYFVSMLNGCKVYGYRHSSIEHIYIDSNFKEIN